MPSRARRQLDTARTCTGVAAAPDQAHAGVITVPQEPLEGVIIISLPPNYWVPSGLPTNANPFAALIQFSPPCEHVVEGAWDADQEHTIVAVLAIGYDSEGNNWHRSRWAGHGVGCLCEGVWYPGWGMTNELLQEEWDRAYERALLEDNQGRCEFEDGACVLWSSHEYIAEQEAVHLAL